MQLGIVDDTRDLLIVDDDFGQVYLLEALLKDLGLSYRCHHAADGRRALDFLYRNPPFQDVPRPHLILLDLDMPGMKGQDVLRQIKNDLDLRVIPVIIFTHSQKQSDISDCYEEQANAYIGKPNDIDSNIKLLRKIDRFWMQVARLPKPVE